MQMSKSFEGAGKKKKKGGCRGEGESESVPDETRVGLDTGAFALDEVEGGVVGHVVRVDEVRDDNR